MICRLSVFILIIVSFNSCDILRCLPFEVVSWSPGEGYHSQPDETVISMNFSLDPDKESVEWRFSLNGDNGRVRGIFSWESRKMTFIPLTPLENNMDYHLSLSAGARDTRGLSMDMAFERKFTTRPDNERPVLVSHYPAMYGETSDPRTEVRLEFSMPIPLTVLYNSISFNPPIAGFWRREENNTLAIFTPAEPWLKNRRYETRVSASLAADNGMNIGNDLTYVFRTGIDREAPVLLEAYRITKKGDIIALYPDITGYLYASELSAENQGWEKDDRLSLVFSKPVDSLSVKNCLSVEDASSLVAETLPGYTTELLFSLNTIPVYESRFTFRLKPGVRDNYGNASEHEYIYRIFANGKNSKPPLLAGIRLPMAPGNSINNEFVFYGIDSLFETIPMKDDDDNYPPGESVKTWIELYFVTADGASIDPFSVMELFRIETSNSVLSFSPRQVKTENFSNPIPQGGWENFQRLEITGTLVNSTNYGVVSFIVSSGLKDSIGNRNDQTFRISLIK